jgi:hypothetical protein
VRCASGSSETIFFQDSSKPEDNVYVRDEPPPTYYEYEINENFKETCPNDSSRSYDPELN